jgi:hypothetical protein
MSNRPLEQALQHQRVPGRRQTVERRSRPKLQVQHRHVRERDRISRQVLAEPEEPTVQFDFDAHRHGQHRQRIRLHIRLMSDHRLRLLDDPARLE